jgi:glucose-6-phosphate dehydrogenase assembly protein OpcA
MPAVSDATWDAQGTTPSAVEAALRGLLAQRHAEAEEYAPARALNLICVVDRDWSGEVANRLRRVGRFAASRTVVVALDPAEDRFDARATIASDVHPKPGQFALLRETVVLSVGQAQAQDLFSVVDPLVVTDLPTVLWSPHGHPEAVDALLPLTQVVLLDSGDEESPAEAFARAQRIGDRGTYVVDLSWLRSTPWRERVAATFDRPNLRPLLQRVAAITIRHAPESQAAALLLVGWLASRLGWRTQPLQGGIGSCRARKGDVRVVLQVDPTMQTRGLSGLTLDIADGRSLALDRGSGGLRAHYLSVRGEVREWTVLGASRGESGILGEGIRQALLRDPTYRPALDAAIDLCP